MFSHQAFNVGGKKAFTAATCSVAKTRALPTTTAMSATGVWAITALWSVAYSLLRLGQAQLNPLWREQRMQRVL